MDVLLVGNSSALLESAAGKMIDSMDTVVRFNGGNPIEHQESIGSKTDYWSFSTLAAAQYMQWRIPGAVPMCLNMRIVYPPGISGAIYNNDETYSRLIDEYGHPRPSTGLITAHFIKHNWHCRICCIGFDFFDSGTWYRGDNNNIPHDGGKEKEYMASLGVTIL